MRVFWFYRVSPLRKLRRPYIKKAPDPQDSGAFYILFIIFTFIKCPQHEQEAHRDPRQSE